MLCSPNRVYVVKNPVANLLHNSLKTNYHNLQLQEPINALWISVWWKQLGATQASCLSHCKLTELQLVCYSYTWSRPDGISDQDYVNAG